MMENTFTTSKGVRRASCAWQGTKRICVTEFTTGEVHLYIDDSRTLLAEEIALRYYVDAHEIYYDEYNGWMSRGEEIPYLDLD